jgi:hypothetical protein
VQVGCVAPPPAPAGLSRTVSGDLVSLAWAAAPGATDYLVYAGTLPGLANLAVLPVDGVTLQVHAPPGVYYVHTRARNGCGTSGPSNDVVVAVGVTAPPDPPTGLQATVSNGHVHLEWVAPAAGTSPTGYWLEAGTEPGAANLARLTLPLAPAYDVDGVPSGTYYVRVRGISGVFPGASSNEITLLVP